MAQCFLCLGMLFFQLHVSCRVVPMLILFHFAKIRMTEQMFESQLVVLSYWKELILSFQHWWNSRIPPKAFWHQFFHCCDYIMSYYSVKYCKLHIVSHFLPFEGPYQCYYVIVCFQHWPQSWNRPHPFFHQKALFMRYCLFTFCSFSVNVTENTWKCVTAFS